MRIAVLAAYVTVLVAITFEGHDIFQNCRDAAGSAEGLQATSATRQGLLNRQGLHRSAL